MIVRNLRRILDELFDDFFINFQGSLLLQKRRSAGLPISEPVSRAQSFNIKTTDAFWNAGLLNGKDFSSLKCVVMTLNAFFSIKRSMTAFASEAPSFGSVPAAISSIRINVSSSTLSRMFFMFFTCEENVERLG